MYRKVSDCRMICMRKKCRNIEGERRETGIRRERKDDLKEGEKRGWELGEKNRHIQDSPLPEARTSSQNQRDLPPHSCPAAEKAANICNGIHYVIINIQSLLFRRPRAAIPRYCTLFV